MFNVLPWLLDDNQLVLDWMKFIHASCLSSLMKTCVTIELLRLCSRSGLSFVDRCFWIQVFPLRSPILVAHSSAFRTVSCITLMVPPPCPDNFISSISICNSGYSRAPWLSDMNCALRWPCTLDEEVHIKHHVDQSLSVKINFLFKMLNVKASDLATQFILWQFYNKFEPFRILSVKVTTLDAAWCHWLWGKCPKCKYFGFASLHILLPSAHWDSDVGIFGLSEAEPENIAFSEWARSLDQFIIPDNYTGNNVLQTISD